MTKISFSVLMLLFALTGIVSCKKDKVDIKDRSQLTKDSIFYYAKEVYLWNTSLPSYSVFNPRGFNRSTDQLTNFKEELLKISRYTANENWYDANRNLYNEPKYSYIDDLVASGQIAFTTSYKASVNLNGDGNDTGLNLGYLGSDRDYDIVVRYVSPNSYAAKQTTIGRGDVILTINGASYGSNFDAEIDRVIKALEQNTVTITGRKRETGAPFSVVLNKTNYVSTPILKDSVYTERNKNIGYLAYAAFSDENNSIEALNSVFQKFASKNVSDLIVDLRYNGGGFVTTAEHLTNLISPARIAGQKMFTEYFNQTMQTGKAYILKKQPQRDERGNITSGNYYDGITYSSTDEQLISRFSKADAAYLNNVENVVFIVSGNTASSSELVINNLKPHINVKIVGRQTYGKPVGFFPIRIDKYDVYFAMFETRNSTGEKPTYYDGFLPDKNISDDFRYEFGDRRENNLAHSIYYLVNGTFSGSSYIASTKGAGTSSSATEVRILDEKGIRSKQFKGMIHLPSEMRK